MNRLTQSLLSLAAVLFGLALFAVPATAQPTELLRYYGDGSSATGAALGSAEKCDVNGDGFDDAVVGAWFWDKAPLSNIGAAYVILGSKNPKGGSLNNPASANAVRIDGPALANAFTGFAVGCLGDVNGDGFDDVGISHYTAQKAYVVFGATDFGPVDLGLLGSRGFEVRGNSSSGNVGFSLAPVGDLDGDGLDEFGVAEVVADTQGRTNNGRIWVISGQDDVADVDLINPAAGQIQMTVDGAYPEERLGVLSEVGDVNGDGNDDFLVGSYTAVPWGTGTPVPGAAAVIWGGTTGTVDLANLGNRGFRIFGPTRGRDRLGISVSGAGDLNGDGKADLLIGSDGVYNAATGNRNGSAWVIFGSASSDTVYTSAPANDTIANDPADVTVYTCANDPGNGVCVNAADVRPRGYRIVGAANSDSTGYSVAGVGDVNGDAVPDFLVGAYGYDPVNPANPPATMSGAGAVWVVYGKSDTTTQNLATIPSEKGYRIDGLAAGDRMGRQVGAFGDFDDNGVNDFFAGGDFASRPLAPGTPLSQAGEVIVALNGALATETALEVSPEGSSDLGQEFVLTARSSRLAGESNSVDSGTYAFALDGENIEGCEAVPAAPGGANCASEPTRRGGHQFTVEYSGEAGQHQPSEAVGEPVRLVDTSGTSIESSAGEITIGRDITFTAAVDPTHGGEAADSGSVAFTVDGDQIEGCQAIGVVEGEAVCETHIDSVGDHQVGASFSGSEDLKPSVAAPISQKVVEAPGSVVQLSRGDAGIVDFGESVDLVAKVFSAGEPADQGAVRFLADGEVIGACDRIELAEGTATCPTSFTRRGRISLTAEYQGTISIRDSVSGVETIDVRDASGVSLSTDRDTVRIGEPIKVTSMVTALQGGEVSGGFVELTAEGCDGCGRQGVVDGRAIHEVSFQSPGTYTLSADFAGDDWLAGSTATPLTVTVTQTPKCQPIRPTVYGARLTRGGRVLGLKASTTKSATTIISPQIRFRRNGRTHIVKLTSRQVRTGASATTVNFPVRAAGRIPAKVRVLVRARSRQLGGDCLATFGPSVLRILSATQRAGR